MTFYQEQAIYGATVRQFDKAFPGNSVDSQGHVITRGLAMWNKLDRAYGDRSINPDDERALRTIRRFNCLAARIKSL